MASRDIANMHFFLDLKKKFPDLPDDTLRNYVALYAEDQHKCANLLEREIKNHYNPSQPFGDFRLPEYKSSVRNDSVLNPNVGSGGSSSNPCPGQHNASSNIQVPSGRSSSHAGVVHIPGKSLNSNMPFKLASMSAPVVADREKPFNHIYQQIPESSHSSLCHNLDDKVKYNQMIFSTTKEHTILPPVSEISTAYLSKSAESGPSKGRHAVKLSITPSFPFQQPQFSAVNNSVCATASHSSRPGRHTTSLNFQLQPQSSDQYPIQISTIPTNLGNPCNSRDFGSHVQVYVGSQGATFTAVRVQRPTYSQNASHLSTCEESPYDGALSSQASDKYLSKNQPSFGINQPFRYPPKQEPFLKEFGSRTIRYDSLQSYQSSPDYILAVKNHQIAQLDSILNELETEKSICSSLKNDVLKMEEKMTERCSSKDSIFNSEELNKLRDENRKLRIECNCLLMEVDMCSRGQIPLGETDEDFYSNIFTGPSGAITSSSSQASGLDIEKLGVELKKKSSFEDDEDDEGNRWRCKKCTFVNHPALEKCEICETAKNSGCFFDDN